MAAEYARFGLQRFQAKRVPVGVKKTRQKTQCGGSEVLFPPKDNARRQKTTT
jgi:hypothetical protein